MSQPSSISDPAEDVFESQETDPSDGQRQRESNELNNDHESNVNNRPWSFIPAIVSLISRVKQHSDKSSSQSSSVSINELEERILEEELTCPICHDIMTEVYVTVCGHSYCHECITVHMETQKDCPICRSSLTQGDIHPNFQLNKLAQFLSKSPKKNSYYSQETTPKDPIEKIIKDSKHDNLSAANSLVDLLSLDDLISVFKVALEQKKKLQLDETKAKNELLFEFLSKLKSSNKQKISQLLDENRNLQLDFDLIAYPEDQKLNEFINTRKRTFSAVNDEEEEEKEEEVNDERIIFPENLNDNDTQYNQQSALSISLKSRMDARFDDLKAIYQNTMSVNESINKRRKLLTEFSSTLFELTKYGQYNVLDTLYYTDSNQFQNTTSIVSSIEFDRDEEFFAIGGVTKDIKLYDFSLMGVNRFSAIHCPLRVMMSNYKISCLSWSPYIKSQLASSDYEGFIEVWDTSTGRKTHTFDEHKMRAWSVDICKPNPTLVASGSDDSTAKVWSLSQNKSVCTLELKGNVCSAQFAPNEGHLLAVGTADHTMSCFDLRNPSKPVQIYQGHKKAVSYVKWLNDNEIVTASTDSTLKLWDKETTNCKMTYSGHLNEKNFVGLSLNDSWISCGSENNTIYTYHKSSPLPVTTYAFPKPASTNTEGEEPATIFVSSVCWKKNSTKLIGANSKGIINVLQMR